MAPSDDTQMAALAKAPQRSRGRERDTEREQKIIEKNRLHCAAAEAKKKNVSKKIDGADAVDAGLPN